MLRPLVFITKLADGATMLKICVEPSNKAMVLPGVTPLTWNCSSVAPLELLSEVMLSRSLAPVSELGSKLKPVGAAGVI